MKELLLNRCATLLFLALSIFISGNVQAQSVRTQVDTDSLRIGDTFNYSLLLQLDEEYQSVQFPDTNSFPSSVEVLNRKQFKLSEFSDSLIYELQYFGNEDLQISSLPVTILNESDTTTLYTDPVTIFFQPVVAEGDTTLKSMKPNYEFPRPWWPWILALIALAAFLIWWFKFREQDEDVPEVQKPTIPDFYDPIKELENDLIRIKEETKVEQTKDFKLFYSQIGDAIRTYFEELYKIPALESTSGELIRYLDAYGVDDILAEKTRNILRRADLVKFAKFTPTLEDSWKTYDEALEFLERAKLTDAPRIGRLKTEYDTRYYSSDKEVSESGGKA
ncbi:MAG: hypothetical protein U5K71_06620 [Gracilimonas sp.]|nr:hypothetical protein [Gracilimonas sp.]